MIAMSVAESPSSGMGGGGGGLHMNTHLPRLFSALTIIMCPELIVSQSMSLF